MDRRNAPATKYFSFFARTLIHLIQTKEIHSLRHCNPVSFGRFGLPAPLRVVASDGGIILGGLFYGDRMLSAPDCQMAGRVELNGPGPIF